jgi:diguanylate cyclase (GGDEF)-like protein/PAS domain S-box-containing protein
MLSQSLLEAVVKEARDGITISDCSLPDNPLVFVNDAFASMTGYDAEEVIGKNCRFLQRGDTDVSVVQIIKIAMLTHEPCLVTLKNYRKDGTVFWNELSLTPIKNEDDIVTHYLGIQKDVSPQVVLNQALNEENQLLKSDKQMLEYLVNMDALTGLHNRRFLENQLAIQWKLASRNMDTLTVFMIDIDFFKAFNDTYGHSAGDQALKTIAKTLNNCFMRGSDFVARYGGEEFTILAIGMTEIQASEYSSRLVQNIEKLHIPHKGSPLGYVTISVGYSQLTPQANLDSNLIIDQADRALYAAKANGKNMALAYKQH